MSSKSSEENQEEHSEGYIHRSISLKLIRHAESRNNEVYRKARLLFRGGTEDFDSDGWNAYVDKHRVADPGISDKGHLQANRLAQYLEPHLRNQASHPVRIITSPMTRTIETLMPTLSILKQKQNDQSSSDSSTALGCQVTVNAFYFESEGCHLRNIPEPGMNQSQIRNLIDPSIDEQSCLSFEGFPDDTSLGWYEDGLGPETRSQSESRADKFYLWICEYLDKQLESGDGDIFDAGVTLPFEEGEKEFDKISPRKRKRRTAILVGHGDFMTLLMKRIVAGFGHAIENDGIPHRTAFVHYNTGITELEYFGRGRFLVMATNQTLHLRHSDDIDLLSGGGLKDGWSYIMPPDKSIMNEEVSVAFADKLEDNVREQTCAMKNLYASKKRNSFLLENNDDAKEINGSAVKLNSRRKDVSIVVKRGLQVVACASFDDQTCLLSDVIIRPSAKRGNAWNALVEEAKVYTAKIQRNRLFVEAETDEEKLFYEKNGFLVEKENQTEQSSLLFVWNC